MRKKLRINLPSVTGILRNNRKQYMGLFSYESIIALFLLLVTVIPILSFSSYWLKQTNQQQAADKLVRTLYEAVISQQLTAEGYHIEVTTGKASIIKASDQIAIYKTEERIYTP